MVLAINNIKVSHGHWKRGASDLDLYEAIQELLENAMYAEGKANATEAHIYTLKVRLGPEDTKEILIIRDNGTGFSSTFFEEEASSLGHTRGYTAKYLVEKKGLGRHGGGMKNSLPPLADDVYTFVCHGHGAQRERYIVRNGETLNKALAQHGKESLQWAYLPGTDMMLAGDDSTFKDSFAALLDLFKEFGEGTGTMFVIATPCSEPPNRLIPADIDGRPDLVRDHDNKGLHEALWNEQYPGRAFEELPIKFFVQRQKEPVDLSANCIVAAAEASGSVSPVIPIQHPSGTLGWLLLAYQDKDATPRLEMANDRKSGLHMAIVCRMLDREPSFFSKADSQSQFIIKAEYFKAKNAYKYLEEMVSVDESVLEGVPQEMHPKMPFTLQQAVRWNQRGGGRNNYWSLGGAGVIGVFVANEAIFTVNVDKDGLKDSQLTPFLHAKLMEHMMAWVYNNPPPDMAAAIAKRQETLAKQQAQAAARAAKAAAAKAAREAQGATVKVEEAAPATPRSTSARAAKAKASNRITSKLALEGAPEHVALGARLRKMSPAGTKKKSAKRNLHPADSEDVAAPKTPGQKGKRPRQADSSDGAIGDGDVDLEWEAFLGDPGKRRGAEATTNMAILLGRKLMAVVADPPSAEQLERVDAIFKSLGKMPVA
ncbi:hypothetical protein COCSUDRAFT_64702 [Coccomyxa subellipsoidea C-169]|uniref:Uncharacterized protein n=1 Tax=Coccomyxa subellipsoidea (strain C-169) TaxID=574566 RepID=I0Z8A9_COCSC|nr:hypothetical protein COCSUDRAFT_64702 [Coccomyxa subellipsoidea C-169]EIE26878.1 hypothetical protein COCSUDRAFT_64702 [Coccomyxa subellipsoidea C-169]|eukprot:XP_005651422.1 hypothetical protein COCSUDRAFT_64702 [Coccomyxa subellipsoidea C-169]